MSLDQTAMKRYFLATVLLLSSVLAGCAHPINMKPDLSLINASDRAGRIEKDVGYYISDAARSLEVTTPGGGGDKVRYFPYRDMEPGFYKALAEVFRGVTKIQNPADKATLKTAGVSLVIVPEIATTSFSDSIITWPPTVFSVSLTCTITDADGKLLETLKVNGDGRASFNEFSGNFSLSAVRASNDAIAKLVKALSESAHLRK